MQTVDIYVSDVTMSLKLFPMDHNDFSSELEKQNNAYFSYSCFVDIRAEALNFSQNGQPYFLLSA